MGEFPFTLPPKGNNMIYVLKYNQKGKEKEKGLCIEFVSQYFLKENRKLQNQINEFIEKIEQFNIQPTKELKEEIENYAESEIFDKRIKLIKYLYESNGLDFEGDDFWEHHVEPKNMNDLLNKSAKMDFEDEEVKKKALTDYAKNALLSAFQSIGDQLTANTTYTK